MVLDVLDAGFHTTVQDTGRSGFERFGVPVSGAMDAFALRAGNALVGNLPDAAALEMTITAPVLYAWYDCLVAVTGGGFGLQVNGADFPAWMAVYARAGSEIRFPALPGGQWGYVCLHGGVQVAKVLGSRSTYLRGHFGGVEGRLIQAGDRLSLGEQQGNLRARAGRALPGWARPRYSDHPTVEVIPGPQADRFTPVGQTTFYQSEYTLTDSADRMGYRFQGAVIEHQRGADILTDGMVFGAVQVPSNGQPVVMMSDRQTTGGYAKIAVVTSASLPVLAQCRPGSSRVRFKAVSVEDAQVGLRLLWQGIEWGIESLDEDHLRYKEF